MNKVAPEKQDTNLNPDGCKDLMAAVAEQAVRDYSGALRVLKVEPDNEPALKMKGECELFFRKYADAWMDTDIDGEKIIAAIKIKVAEEKRGVDEIAGQESMGRESEKERTFKRLQDCKEKGEANS